MEQKFINQTTEQVKISVIIPALNEEEHIENCIRSVILQDFKDYELIVVDNGSTDNTAEIAKKLGAKVIFEPRKGLPQARETGRKEAKGEILLYIDADTIIPDSYLTKVFDFFKSHDDVIALTNPFLFYDGNWKTDALIKLSFKVICPFYYKILGALNLPKFILGGNFAVRKSILDKIGGFNTSIEFYGEDIDISRRLSKEGNIAYLSDLYSLTSARRYITQGTFKTTSIYLSHHFRIFVDCIPKISFRLPKYRLTPSLVVMIVGLFLFSYYGSAYPKSKIFGKVIHSLNTHNKKIVALTFDDGPNDIYTKKVLDILDKKGVKATFFLIGKNVEVYPQIAKEIVRRGHSIGNHSYTHPWLLPIENESKIIEEIDKAEQAIYNATGVYPKIFRPPHGLRTPWMNKIIHKQGYVIFTWNNITTDYQLKTKGRDIAKKILANVKPGAIIVLHDGVDLHHKINRENMIEALIIIVDELKKEGYQFVTLNENIE